MEWHCAKN
jgi:hypothetical protein